MVIPADSHLAHQAAATTRQLAGRAEVELEERHVIERDKDARAQAAVAVGAAPV